MCCAWNRCFESSRVKIGNNATATRTSKKNKQTNNRFNKQNSNFARASRLSRFFAAFAPHFTFCGERKQAMTKRYFSLWTWIWSLGIRLQEGSSGFDKVSRRVVFKTDRTLIHFSSEVLVAVASLDLEVPSIITHELELYCHLVSCWVHVLSIHSRFSSFLLVTMKY